MWMRPQESVLLGKVSTYGRLIMQCLYVAGTLTECPLRRGVQLREVSVSGDSTVYTDPG